MSSGMTNLSSDDEENIFESPAIAESVLNKSKSQCLFEESNNSMKTLLLLCRGLKDDNGNTVFDLESNPIICTSDRGHTRSPPGFCGFGRIGT
jgi:hypothetical protein